VEAADRPGCDGSGFAEWPFWIVGRGFLNTAGNEHLLSLSDRGRSLHDTVQLNIS
jgi:hypothetical protein